MAAAAAMGDLFAPAYIHGNPESEAAVAKWQAENHALTPAIIEQTRGPSTTITHPGVGGIGRGLRGGYGSTTQTDPGSVDQEALRILAQGGKYAMPAPPAAAPPAAAPVAAPAANPQRDEIARQLMGGAGRLTPVGGGVFLPEFDTSQPQSRIGYPWGQNGPDVTS